MFNFTGFTSLQDYPEAKIVSRVSNVVTIRLAFPILTGQRQRRDPYRESLGKIRARLL